ncbi:hypothetical protein N7517_011060 [Penicillium concentricum]|uniref:LysM domain-containing protein n=1 Tax=Penicillium concentricum TaxID=293559 RepID=A0A9W9RA74_9EURO|nr:uncharacterized protein N7517_011060 [Penicillium concentricum]KAJ5356451.1 hypothetical protein N7517_011060 [Penicillium concentricum]
MNSPLGYDAAIASNLASLTSVCNATVGYGFTTPTPYALNSTSKLVTTSTTTTAIPTCTEAYTVQATDNCHSVALAHNVSTYNLLFSNDLDLYCENFATVVNSTLCVPQKCSTYVWKGQDSCDSVTRGLNGVTVAQFLSWNPIFDMLCRNSLSYIGYVVCLSSPGGDPVTFPSSGSSTQMVPTVTSKVPAPTNAMNGTNTNCGGWYTVQKGDTCARISVANSLSLSDFYFLTNSLQTVQTYRWAKLIASLQWAV